MSFQPYKIGIDKQTYFICHVDSKRVHLHNYMLVLDFMFD
jgi:hypothetical protein